MRTLAGEKCDMAGKRIGLEKALDLVEDGNTLVMGGGMSMAPMAIIREILKQGRKDLNIVCAPAGGINVDILIGAGLVRSIQFGQVFFDGFGMAPNFRRLAQEGKLLCKDLP
jgi:glutaconate CoA-transferase subunit A